MSKKKSNKKGIQVKAKLRTYKAIIRFCLIFLGLLLILTTTFPFLSETFNPQLTWVMEVTADVTGFFLRALGFGCGGEWSDSLHAQFFHRSGGSARGCMRCSSFWQR